MSRIGILPVKIESGVEVNAAGSTVTVKGPKGELSIETPDFLDVKVDDGHVKVTRTKEFKQAKAMHGTVRSLINGMIEGVGKGFTKELTIEGVGYRAAMKGSQLVMSVGYSHPIEYDIMDGVEVKVDKDTSITVTGIDKQKVGQTAARIRAFAPAEPYKGKGIKYKGEKIRRKAGKTVA